MTDDRHFKMPRTDEKYLYLKLTRQERGVYRQLKSTTAKGYFLLKACMRHRKLKNNFIQRLALERIIFRLNRKVANND